MKQLLTAFLVILCLTVTAQKKDTVLLDPSGFESEQKITLPFSAVKIIDARFDRTNVGSMHKKISGNRLEHERVPTMFPDSFHLFLPKLIGNIASYSPNSKDTLVILFKQFRVVEHLVNNQNQNYEPKMLLKVSASFFRSKNDSFIRILSIDDWTSIKWPIDRRLTKEIIEKYRIDAFMKSLKGLLERKNWQDNGTIFAKKSVEEALQKRFQLPLFTDNILNSGLYKTFKEFKTNSPSVSAIKVKMKKGVPIELTDSFGKKIDLKNYWGVCIENKRFIFFREKFYELQQSDRSFRFLSYSRTADLFGQPSFGDYAPQAGIIGAALIKAGDSEVSRQYFYLNMDEEEIYLEEIFGNSKTLKANHKELLH